MTPVSDKQATIVRTERGLTISGTRLTLYDLMDFLKAEYSPKLIRNRFNLTDDQINAAMSYIEANRDRASKLSINRYYKQEQKFAPIGKSAIANGSIALQ